MNNISFYEVRFEQWSLCTGGGSEVLSRTTSLEDAEKAMNVFAKYNLGGKYFIGDMVEGRSVVIYKVNISINGTEVLYKEDTVCGGKYYNEC